MPRNFLPTPASSTDIKGQDGSKMASLQLAFELPPPAVATEAASSNAPTSAAVLYPAQASETVKSRRRSSAANQPKDQFTLPPPPTRSRKIIQMKPREDHCSETSTSASKTASRGKTGTTPATTTAGTKRKEPSATSAAGRKMARKTAHSIIERRRRSKMNEEFAVLKSLIPACTGEMHKLAILQAAIEYVRYLEDCVAKLKAQCGSGTELDREPRSIQSGLPSPSLEDNYSRAGCGYSAASAAAAAAAASDTRSTDVDMASSSSGAPSPSFTPIAGRSQQQPSVSPALGPRETSRNNSYSSVSSDFRLHDYCTSATTSPSFGPQRVGHPTDSPPPPQQQQQQGSHSAYSSTLTSPALPPQRDMDQEVTTALLMLNQMDRRATGGGTGGGTREGSTANGPRGMSVRDLLSS
ncbi:hypothetical protein L209DRAFT_584851 [Thermothelomyces heterothallicus CBS 203.75]